MAVRVSLSTHQTARRYRSCQAGIGYARPFWPDLSELMLFWLCAPVSTAGLERLGGISFHTLIDQDTRRRRCDTQHMRDDMLVHIHRNWFNKRLENAC